LASQNLPVKFAREVIVRGQRWVFDPSLRFVSPPDPGPYDPCWCWSGKKFKFCHRDKHRETPKSDRESIGDWEQGVDIEICLHPNAPATCSGEIINAHTVQRSGGGLAVIARAGKVYGPKMHPMFFIKNGGRFVPQPVGISEASTFRGFCAAHDAVLFRPIDTREFIASSEQLLLLNFRVIARRLHTNMRRTQNRNIYPDMDRGMSRDKQRLLFVGLAMEHELDKAALANTLALKAIYDNVILTGAADDASINALVIHVSGSPEFMCSTLVDVDWDFAGSAIERVLLPAHLCFYSMATSAGAVAVFSWLGENAAARQLCASFLGLAPARQRNAVLRYALEYVDNIFFDPAWWDGLKADQRERFIDRMSRRHPSSDERPASALQEDGEHTEPRVVSCQIIGNWFS